jgi:hypothetical protein
MIFKSSLSKLVMCTAACFGLIAPSAAQSFADCNVPTVADDLGPLKKSLYVVGTFPGASWMHVPARKMAYKGKGVYQLVNDEKAGPVTFQFATLNWNPQYTAKGLAMTPGTEAALMQGSMAKDTAVTLPADGKYVWSIEVDDSKKGVRGVVAACK